MKTLLLTTEDWAGIEEAVIDARNALGIEIDIKKIDIDLSNESFYETKPILFWNKVHRVKSIATNVIYALGLSNNDGKQYDCYGVIVDYKKSKQDALVGGQQAWIGDTQIIEVYANKNKRKSHWGYNYTTYSVIHELIHALDKRRGVGGQPFHNYLEKNKTLDAYISTFKESKTNDLLPVVKRKADRMIKAAKLLGMDLRITSGYRSKEEQDKLYAQGRTKPGKIVTNAKGGESMHNHALAWDVVDRKLGYNLSDYQWKWLGVIAALLGVEWGGTWKSFKDKPHFQYLAGYTEEQIRKGDYDKSKFM